MCMYFVLCVVRWMSDDIIELLTQSMIAPRPNTYTYTKAIAETLLVELCSASNVPCAIVRPSIVGASWQQPVAVSYHFCNLQFIVKYKHQHLEFLSADENCNATQ